ncbi:hypothetical protein ACKVMT_05815 [Halobacteriales archaeon Cl-PHB]
MNVGYAVGEILKHWKDRQWWRKRFLTHVVSRYYATIGKPDADPLVDQDWDNVVLLDACRFDLFEKALADHPLPGTLSKRTSAESGTPGYLAENFAGRQFHDVVYVTANPYVQTELPDDTFHAVDHVWQDGWDDDLQTVAPETMAKRALAAAKRYPDKRLIIHFNQPHAPFIGDVRLDGRKGSAIRQTALGKDKLDPSERHQTPFEQLGDGKRTKREVWKAYLSNLERAMPHVERLLDSLKGLTAVTSDHGNGLGEFATPFPIRVYGHPLGTLIPALTDVPWHVNQNGERKQVTVEAPQSSTDVDESTEERLRMLGYAE